MNNKDFNDYDCCDIEQTELRIFRALTLACVFAMIILVLTLYCGASDKNTQIPQDKTASSSRGL